MLQTFPCRGVAFLRLCKNLTNPGSKFRDQDLFSHMLVSPSVTPLTLKELFLIYTNEHKRKCGPSQSLLYIPFIKHSSPDEMLRDNIAVHVYGIFLLKGSQSTLVFLRPDPTVWDCSAERGQRPNNFVGQNHQTILEITAVKTTMAEQFTATLHSR